MKYVNIVVVSSLLQASCGGSQGTPAASTPANDFNSESDSADTESLTFASQVKAGATLYSDNCAVCHGDAGEGGAGPAVVGLSTGALPLYPPEGAARDAEFRNALDVFVWVKANMPPNKGGSLSDEEYVAILAFDLKANGVELDAPLDGASAKTLVLHAEE